MPDKNKAKDIIERQSKLKGRRYNFESQWQEIQYLVRPHTSYFLFKNIVPGDRRTLNIFDSTAPYCNDQLASGLHASLTSSTDRWFNLTAVDQALMQADEVLRWLEIVSDIIYLQYSLPRVRLNTNLHENYLDLGAFGTSNLYQDFDMKMSQLRFRAFPLSDCYIGEDANGLVNQMYRNQEFQYQQACEYFGEEKLPEKMRKAAEKDPTMVFKFIHFVGPREYYDPSQYDSGNMPFAECWVAVDFAETVKESGFRENPYHTARWETVSGEIYGRGPGMVCLADIKMVNEMTKVMIRRAQKEVDPPIVITDDGYKKNFNMKPGGTIYKEPGAEAPFVFEMKGQLSVGVEAIQQRQDSIQKAFFLDQLIMPEKKERQSVLERQQNRDEQLRQMSPHIGRLESELCGPMLARSYNLLRRAGVIPPPPTKLRGAKLMPEYVSPAARAQVLGKKNAISQLIQDTQPLMQVDPAVMDALDTDEVFSQMAILGDVTRRIIRSPRDIAAIRKRRQDQQQMTAAAEAANQGSQAIKNVAQAQQAQAGAPVAGAMAA